MLGHMRASLLLFAALLLAGFPCGCALNEPHHPVTSEPPAIFISQIADYPMPDYPSEFHFGVVVKLWRDGRMVRATRLDTVGKSYVQGFVKPAAREEFFASLGTNAAMKLPEGGDLVVDSASETITVRRDGKTSKWIRTLPDKQSVWREFESRLMGLPLSDSRSLDLKEVESMSWNE
jgi:hypothetical protein